MTICTLASPDMGVDDHDHGGRGGGPPVGLIAPALHEGGPDERAVLVWRFAEPVRALSSAPVGGGPARLDWLVNIEVGSAYARCDLAVHVAEVSARLGLTGSGAGLLTAAQVARVCSAEDGGVLVQATVGVTRPTWAAGPDGSWSPEPWRPGTINTVVQLPVALSPAAAVNAVVTATEAKSQALVEAGVPGTGTASDAVVVLWPADAPQEDFCGPRSTWGARLARAVHLATAAGLERRDRGRRNDAKITTAGKSLAAGRTLRP